MELNEYGGTFTLDESNKWYSIMLRAWAKAAGSPIHGQQLAANGKYKIHIPARPVMRMVSKQLPELLNIKLFQSIFAQCKKY